MAKVEVSQEDLEFLKDLQHELCTQTNDGNADPVFWGIMEDEEVAVPSGCGDCEKISYDDGALDIDNAISEVDECIIEYPVELRELWKDVDKTNIYDIFDFMRYKLEWDDVYDVFDFMKQDKLCRFTGAFLTKREATRYVKTYAYNHNNPRTYAMTAYRNFELERLLKILKTIKFE